MTSVTAAHAYVSSHMNIRYFQLSPPLLSPQSSVLSSPPLSFLPNQCRSRSRRELKRGQICSKNTNIQLQPIRKPTSRQSINSNGRPCHHRRRRRHHHHHPLTLRPPKSHHPHTCSFSSSFSNNNPSPSETDCPVPLDQQPINEYQALANSFPFSWASADLVEYCSRLLATGASFALLVGLPVSWVGSRSPDPIRLALGAASSGLFVAILAVVRMYLGWAYVGNRLLSATVEYEETGWYDGQIWVKTAQVLARDRLLGSFSVKPVLGRLKNSLVVLGTSLLICIVLLLNSDNNGQKNAYIPSEERGGRAIPGVYNDESARNFEPDAFCGEPTVQ